MNQPRSKISVLVVDDEVPARKRLVELLGKDADIATVLEAANGVAAVAIIEEKKPDLVLLDVQMPEVDGFGVIEAVGVEQMPLTIFVTAYDRFALRAFDEDAVDYLLKPFGSRRFEQAMARAKLRLQNAKANANANAWGQNVLELAAKRASPGEIWDYLVVKAGGITRFVSASEIDWIEAAGVYVNLHVGGKEFVYRISLGAIAKRLDPFRFVRIHRSSVVNIRAVVHLEPLSHGEFEVLLRDGARLALSRHYRANVEARLGQSL
ncbi:MAG: response regulator transcription factor [Alphaproteobacteria bacterium]|nr:response regulator transcription factor [Alphaproteobacteria bacterium]